MKVELELKMTNALVKKPVTKDISTILAGADIKKRFEEVLGRKSAAFMSSIISATKSNKMLSSADPMSVISSAMVAATLDLPINPSLGMAHIVPYKGQAQFQIGWKGVVQLALRSGQYKTINLTPVLEGQLVGYNRFTGEMEFQEESISDKAIGYLLYFKLINGYEKFFYMTREECQQHAKKFSATYKKGFGVWADDFDAMALKTVAKLGLQKYGVLSTEMQTAMISDQAVFGDDLDNPEYVDNQPEPSIAEKMNKRQMKDVTPEQEPPIPEFEVSEQDQIPY